MRNILKLLPILIGVSASAASTPHVLRSFGVNQQEGSDVYAGLILDAAGNAYGATESGGSHNSGVVFRLSPDGTGRWTETILHEFKGSPEDGATPHASLVFDGAGNLYGTTVSGGIASSGTVFKLAPTSEGQWTETVLHRFTGGADGATPYGAVILDAVGNIYGITAGGGSNGLGAVYKLSSSPGVWTETVLHSFTGADGTGSFAALVFDKAGNLYGTTFAGGTHNDGTVFRLALQPDGTWLTTVLHNFKGNPDGVNPGAGVILDNEGNVYGTTSLGGTANCGIAFKLSAANGWEETLLHTFLGILSVDGENPTGLTFNGKGFYGTTVGGGEFNPGTIYSLAPDGNGLWTETVLYSFTGGNDGAYPSVGLTLGPKGGLYGTTLWGGPAGTTVGGVAFEFNPN